MPQNDEHDVLIDLGVLAAEPAEEYHAKRGEHLNSHGLIDFMVCPWLYRKKQLGLSRTPRSTTSAAKRPTLSCDVASRTYTRCDSARSSTMTSGNGIY